MEVTILFFANIREKAGTKSISLQLPDNANIKHLKERLRIEFPALVETLDTSLLSINQEFAFEEDEIPDGSEVAVFPPVSGGSEADIPIKNPTFVYISGESLDLNYLLNQITLPSTGAVCMFTGVVRAVTNRHEFNETEYLEYEAYLPMAETKIHQVVNEIRRQWPLIEGIVIVQRIGRLYSGTPTIFIACSAAHRDTGVFEAARYGIDRLKEIVPIWKRETGMQGEHWIQGEYHPKKGD
jgi:molybdopterin synthase catalytic subunit